MYTVHSGGVCVGTYVMRTLHKIKQISVMWFDFFVVNEIIRKGTNFNLSFNLKFKSVTVIQI